MKLKVMVSVILCTVMLNTSIYASEIDLSSLSMEQLIDLRTSINTFIAENGGENVIGKGTYEVGVDIMPGYYKIVCSKNAGYGFINVETYPTKEEYENNENWEVSQIYYNDEEPVSSECTTVNL